MYSGIVKGVAPVSSLDRFQDSLSYSVEMPLSWLDGLVTGASVSIDGVCQTVVRIEENNVFFDVISETLRLTTLSDLKVGQRVNVERSLRLGDEIGGHALAGHISDTVVIEKVVATPENRQLTISCDAKWMPYLLPKGFVAVDGASLTIGEVEPEGRFTLHLIPETLRLTTLGWKGEGDRLNLEIDAQTQAIVHTVRNVLAQQS